MELKKKIWLNNIAMQLSIKNRTFGHLIKYKIGSKNKSRSNYKKNLMKKNKDRKLLNKFSQNKEMTSDLKPGSVLILLSQKLLGKKAILINTTESGLLVVTGPFSINGISLRRVNKKYTMDSGATLDTEKFNSPGLKWNPLLFNDEYFKTLAKSKSKGFDYKNHDFVISHRIRQNYIDKFICSSLKKDFFIKAYLQTRKPSLFSN